MSNVSCEKSLKTLWAEGNLLNLSPHRQREEDEKINHENGPINWDIKNFRGGAKKSDQGRASRWKPAIKKKGGESIERWDMKNEYPIWLWPTKTATQVIGVQKAGTHRRVEKVRVIGLRHPLPLRPQEYPLAARGQTSVVGRRGASWGDKLHEHLRAENICQCYGFGREWTYSILIERVDTL